MISEDKIGTFVIKDELNIGYYTNSPIIKYIMEVDNSELNIIYYKFREFFVLFKDFYIGVYPFAYKFLCYNGVDDDMFNYKFFVGDNLKVIQNSQHHQDYKRGTIQYDPCLIFEKISGFKIHTENYSELNEYDKGQEPLRKQEFFEYVNRIKRNNKLNTIIDQGHQHQ